jgi:Lipocalin-like domain
MKRHCALTVLALAILGLALPPDSAVSQQKSLKDQLVGTWTLLIDDSVHPDGSQTPLFGPNPNGIVTFEASGKYKLDMSRSNMPKLASSDPASGTADENKTALGGAIAHNGTYTVDEAAHALTFRADGGSAPNLQQTQQKWQLNILSADDLKWEAPRTAGGGSEVLYWRRAK